MTSHWPDASLMSWGTLLALGAFHGVNPGMGWLFAVALGMQENRAAAVWRSLLPLGLGHACAIALAVLFGVLAGAVMPAHMLRWPIGCVLIALGIRMLLRHAHPRWGGMRIGMIGLTIWSFLIATAHGAGLMVLPVWLGMSASAHDHGHASHMTVPPDVASALLATIVHGAGYLLVTACIAWVVFTRLGVELLRTKWINLDLVWGAALIVSGALTFALAI
jgi:hypothetical protein